MPTTETVVIGGGHAGLAVSSLLTIAGRDHVVLDRGRIGERWRSERWDSLNLLTPNWLTRLPGWCYTGPSSDGYMSAGEFVDYLERYAKAFGAPVETRTTVLAVAPQTFGYQVVTDKGTWRTRHVVIATGPHGRARVPNTVRHLPADVALLTANQYRNAGGLPAGGVLVVGASSSGLQIADELARAGRAVVLAVGRHTRMPRRYRGMDIFWWLERTGRLARTIDEFADPAAARREPSLQLVGRNNGGAHEGNLDLAVLQSSGVVLAGRLESLEGDRATFRDDLPDTTAGADERMHRFLQAVDQHIADAGLGAEVWPATRLPSIPLRAPSVGKISLRSEGIRTVLFATGYRPDYSWLRLPLTEPDGTIRQCRGVTSAPGIYVVGQRFQHRRDSAFIDGARHNAHAVVSHLTSGAVSDASPQDSRV